MDRKAYQELIELEQDHWWFVGRRTVIRKILSKFVGEQSGKHILEAGCGSGGNLKLLNKFGKVSAFELDDLMREHAQGLNLAEIRPGKLPDEFPYEETFDVICMFDVLEHIEQDKATVEDIFHCLNQGGKCILSVPAFMFLWSDHDIANHHFRRYRRKPLVNMLKQAGFKVEYASYFNTFLFPIICFIRIWVSKLRKSQKTDLKKSNGFVNKVLTKIFGSESVLMPSISYPFGLSIMIVAEKT